MKGRGFVLTVFGVGLLVSLAIYWVVQRQLDSHQRVEFEWVARERILALQREVDGVLGELHSFSERLRLQPRFDSATFRKLTDSLRDRIDGVHSVAWAPSVEQKQRSAYEQDVGSPILEWHTDGAKRVADLREIYLPLRLVYPDTAAPFPRDLDLGSIPHFRTVLETADGNHRMRISGQFPLSGEDTGHFVFVVSVPIVELNDPANPAVQNVQIKGFLLAAFKLDELALDAFSTLEPRGVDVLVTDNLASGDRELLYHYTSRLNQKAPDDTTFSSAGTRLRLSETISLADRRWTLTAVATDSFRSAEAFTQGPLTVLLAGLLFTGMTILYMERMRRSLQQRRRMADALIERDVLFSQMAETLNEVVWALDLSRGELLYLSPACEHIWGDCRQLRERPEMLRERVREKDLPRLDEAIHKVIEMAETVDVEIRVHPLNGEERWLRTRAMPVVDANQRVHRVVGLTEDINARKLGEKALRKSEKKLRNLFNQSPDILMTVDPDGHILLLNRSLPNLSIEQASGKASELLLPDDTRERYRQSLSNVLTTGNIGHFRYARADASWWEMRIVPIKQAGSVRAAMIIASDVTERQNLLDQATRNARLASVGALAAGVAHEVNNPNNAILFNASLFRRAWRDALPVLDEYFEENGDYSLGGLPFSEFKDTADRLLGDIVNNSERIRRIIDNLKHLARRDNENLDQKIDVGEVLHEAVAILRHPIQQHSDHFSLEVANGLPQVTGNSQLLEQVFINVILNALQSLPDRDHGVQVSAEPDTARQQVSIRVIDQGKGIAEAHLARLTEPFFTTRADAGGTGLGLSISRSIVERHKGSLTFESAPGRGTTVNIRLPIGQAERVE